MDQAFQPNLDFAAVDDADAAEAFVVDLEGYEGPLHVLLALARTQKVDLLKLSITRLADWTPLDQVAPAREAEDGEGPSQASYTASTLSASLELVKEGAMDVRQAEAFADLFLKRRGLGQPLELTP